MKREHDTRKDTAVTTTATIMETVTTATNNVALSESTFTVSDMKKLLSSTDDDVSAAVGYSRLLAGEKGHDYDDKNSKQRHRRRRRRPRLSSSASLAPSGIQLAEATMDSHALCANCHYCTNQDIMVPVITTSTTAADQSATTAIIAATTNNHEETCNESDWLGTVNRRPHDLDGMSDIYYEDEDNLRNRLLSVDNGDFSEDEDWLFQKLAFKQCHQMKRIIHGQHGTRDRRSANHVFDDALTMAEEFASTAAVPTSTTRATVKTACNNQTMSHTHRQRAYSEPNEALLRHGIFQRALQGGFRRRGGQGRTQLLYLNGNINGANNTYNSIHNSPNHQGLQYHHFTPKQTANPMKTLMRISDDAATIRKATLFCRKPLIRGLTDNDDFANHSTALSPRSALCRAVARDMPTSAESSTRVASAATNQSLELTPTTNAVVRSNSNHSSNNSDREDAVASLSADTSNTNGSSHGLTNNPTELPNSDSTTSNLEGPLPVDSAAAGTTNGNNGTANDSDPNRNARLRWIRINRRFQLIITVVALIFSLLLFGILVCWVVLTSAYVVSIDKVCDVPLKCYFWLVTLQLIMDVFRSDLLRLICRWDSNSRERIPCRVITYNILYLTYALLVLRLGIRSVFVEHGGTCRHTAPELYQSSTAFVTLTIAAWSTIVLGYLVPFCFVATLLTWNGYTPASDADQQARMMGSGFGGVFPISTPGAPPECIEQMRVVSLEDFPNDFPRECCICIGDFVTDDVVVATVCNHVFHKQCCREWLRQARTCPVCRADIPTSLPQATALTTDQNTDNIPASTSLTNDTNPASSTSSSSSPPADPGGIRSTRPSTREALRHEVVNFFRFFTQHENRAGPNQHSRHQETQSRSSTHSLSHPSNNERNSENSSFVEMSDLGRARSDLTTSMSPTPLLSATLPVSGTYSRSAGDLLASMEEGNVTNHQHST